MTAACVAILFFGSVIPFSTIAAPAAAAICVMFFCLEYNRATAFLVYASVSLLAVLVSPDKELALLFCCFFGYYPILKGMIEARFKPLVGILLKIVMMNGALFAMYYVILNIFIIAPVRDEFASFTNIMFAAFIVLGNITFLVYDLALTKISFLYFAKLRGKLIKKR
ncbi:MAG: hypothetical protein RSD39_07875 [Oscillospiraceae bacterium]